MSAPPSSLCVVLHDVAPPTWPACRRVLAAVQEVAALPLTLLLVPHYHRAARDRDFEAQMSAYLAQGSELALHGYTHTDSLPVRHLGDRLRRRFYTAGEGEFSGLTHADALWRLWAGRTWFAEQGWPLHGFVAPAWLLSSGSWAAVRAQPFRYTSTLRYLHMLPERERLLSQSLVYSTRGAWRRALSLAWNTLLAGTQTQQPLIRLELHPGDADHPQIRRSWQALLERQLRERQAMTTISFIESWQRGAGNSLSLKTG